MDDHSDITQSKCPPKTSKRVDKTQAKEQAEEAFYASPLYDYLIFCSHSNLPGANGLPNTSSSSSQ